MYRVLKLTNSKYKILCGGLFCVSIMQQHISSVEEDVCCLNVNR